MDSVNSSLLSLVKERNKNNTGVASSDTTATGTNSDINAAMQGNFLFQQLTQQNSGQQQIFPRESASQPTSNFLNGFDISSLDPTVLSVLASMGGTNHLLGLSQDSVTLKMLQKVQKNSASSKKANHRDGIDVPYCEEGNIDEGSAYDDSASDGKGPSRQRSRRKSSNYRGVSRCAKDGRWQARIRIGRMVKYLGRYKTEMDAAKRYDIAAKRYHGTRAVLNFSDIPNLSMSDLEEGDKGPENKSDDDNEIDLKLQSHGGFSLVPPPPPNSMRTKRSARDTQHDTGSKKRQSGSFPKAGFSNAIVSDLHAQAITYHQLLRQMTQLGAVSVKNQLCMHLENRAQLQSDYNASGVADPLLIGLTAGMLSGVANLSDAAIASTISSNLAAGNHSNPPSKTMTGAISGLISLNQNM